MIGKKLVWAHISVALAICSVIVIAALDQHMSSNESMYIAVFGTFATVLALMMIINIIKNGEY